jgi:hypothetical protein
MDEVRRQLDVQDWDTIAKKLTLHAYSRFKFWNLLRRKALKGYSPEEIALEAIALVYSGDRKWDPLRSDLLTYLKFHVVNGLVANLARNKEILTTDVNEIVEAEYEFSIEEDLNARMIIDGIRESLDDNFLKALFDSLLQGGKRSDIMKSLSLTPREYDNALKRLKARILKRKKMSVIKK